MRIPLSSPSLSDLERGYVADAMAAGWISGTGSYITRFEEALGHVLERSHVVAVPSGTAALELALLALDIEPGDQVIVPGLTFVSPAAAVRSVGADVVLADIEPRSWTIDVTEVAKLTNRKTKAIVAVDLLGHTCDYDGLEALGVPIIQDAAQAHGAKYRGKPAGGSGAISVLSFHANKAITTGEGGCVATNDESLAERMRLISNHGMAPSRPYWHPVVGRNFRMTNLSAAIGLGQVERWEELISARRRVAETYNQCLKDLRLTRRPVASWTSESCWLYTRGSPRRASILEGLRERGIDSRGIWDPIRELPPYRNALGGDCPVAREVSRTAFWLPTSAEMTCEQVEEVAHAVRRIMSEVAA